MKRVMIFGSFDVLHEGHRYLFRKAKEHGDKLIVVVARDSRYKELRGYTPKYHDYERLEFVAEEEDVDEVLLGDIHDVHTLIREHKPEVIVLGYDQKNYVSDLREKLDSFGLRNTEIVRLDAYKPEKYKSSLLKEQK